MPQCASYIVSAVVSFILVIFCIDLLARDLCFPPWLGSAIDCSSITSSNDVEFVEEVMEDRFANECVVVADHRFRLPVGFVDANAGSCMQGSECHN